MKQLENLAICFLFCFFVGNSWIVAQEPSLQIDTVYKTSPYITIHLQAEKNGKSFYQFDGQNQELKAFETIKGSRQELKINYLGKVENQHTNEIYLQLKVDSTKDLHRESRIYTIEWYENGKPITQDLKIKNWSYIQAFNLKSGMGFSEGFTYGILILLLLLLAFSEGIPMLKLREFKKNVITHRIFHRTTGFRRHHPIKKGELLPDDELLVYLYPDKCELKDKCGTALSVWRSKNYQCQNYHECHNRADIGAGQFFQQVDSFQLFNWIWFGAVGGFLGWIVSNLYTQLFAPSDFWVSVSWGVGLGFGITLALSWAEEVGPGQRIREAWPKILMRAVAGGIISGLLFMLGFGTFENPGIIGPLIWMTCSVALGYLMSVRSSLSTKRGIISGLIAGLLSAIVYVLLLITEGPADFIRLLSFMSMGLVMGGLMKGISTRLETIQLEVISPSIKAGFITAIDGWLLEGKMVVIGNDLKSKNVQVRVKWSDDEVYPRHAEIYVNKHKVFIRPIKEALIWVNGQIYEDGASCPLEGGDEIRLGRKGNTVFRYIENRKIQKGILV
ncbi:MAG: FHA domain-containing protein [Bacteroidota bacterium]